MTRLIELRENIRRIYGKHSRLIGAAVKFILSLITFLLINYYTGYLKALNHIYVALFLAVLCAAFPVNTVVFAGTAMIMAHLYALSMETAVTALLFFAIMFFLYFRFSPKNGYCVMLTPVAFVLRIPYVMPVAAGLLGGPASVISVIFGTMLYYFLNGVRNSRALLETSADAAETANKFVVSVNQLLGNKEMYLMIAAVLLSALAVYFLRCRVMEHAWSAAIGAGILMEFVILCAGYLIMGISGKMLWLVLGSLLSGGIALVIDLLFCNMDYSRTERVQFEDDEYYYEVKAVPKINLASGQKQVKKIAGKKNEERITKKQLARELDIDEDMLD